MPSLDLPNVLMEELLELSRQTELPATDLACEAITRFLNDEDIKDLRMAIKISKKVENGTEPTFSSQEVRDYLKLNNEAN